MSQIRRTERSSVSAASYAHPHAVRGLEYKGALGNEAALFGLAAQKWGYNGCVRIGNTQNFIGRVLVRLEAQHVAEQTECGALSSSSKYHQQLHIVVHSRYTIFTFKKCNFLAGYRD